MRKVAHGRFRKASGAEIRGSVKSWFKNAFWGKGICPWKVPKKRLELKIQISSNPGLENLFFGEEFCPRETSKERLKLKILTSWKHGFCTGVV